MWHLVSSSLHARTVYALVFVQVRDRHQVHVITLFYLIQFMIATVSERQLEAETIRCTHGGGSNQRAFRLRIALPAQTSWCPPPA